MLKMLLHHTPQRCSGVVLYKRDGSNVYGTVDPTGITHLLRPVLAVR